MTDPDTYHQIEILSYLHHNSYSTKSRISKRMRVDTYKIHAVLLELIEEGYVERKTINGYSSYFLTERGEQYLEEVTKMADKNIQIKGDKICIAIPDDFTDWEREALVSALEMDINRAKKHHYWMAHRKRGEENAGDDRGRGEEI